MRCICLNQNKWRIFPAHSPKFWRLIWISGSSSFSLISLILDSEKETSLCIFSAKISRTTFKYQLIVAFWCSALHQSQWLRQESLKDTVRSPFYLMVNCVLRLLFNQKITHAFLKRRRFASFFSSRSKRRNNKERLRDSIDFPSSDYTCFCCVDKRKWKGHRRLQNLTDDLGLGKRSRCQRSLFIASAYIPVVFTVMVERA